MAEQNPEPAAARMSMRAAAFGLCWLLLGGCAAQRPAVEPTREHWIPSYAFGIWGRSEIDTRDDCPATGAARIRVGATWSTLLVSIATLGIYTPREVIVHCRALP